MRKTRLPEYLLQRVYVRQAKWPGQSWRRRGCAQFSQRHGHRYAGERNPLRRSPDSGGELPTGNQEFAHLPQGRLQIGQKHQAKPAEDSIEAALRQFQRLGVHLTEVDVV